MTFVLTSRRVVVPGGGPPVPAAVHVRDGRIEKVVLEAEARRHVEPGVDLGERVLMPGIVDTHAHVNEPGRTEWEGFATATRAARAGGITTVIDMPLNSIPATTTLAALAVKRAAAAAAGCAIDYGFWGGVVPGNLAELAPMARAGVAGFKCFLCPSGVDEFPHVGEAELRPAMIELARLGLPLIAHAELELPAPAAHGRAYSSYLASRPPEFEVAAIRLLIRLARETGCRTHVVHLSAADALDDLATARLQGVPISAETCPHYLTFAAEDIPEGKTEFKCAPPIRDRANRERLWDAVRAGVIELIVSDHSPCTPALKRREDGDFAGAWGGIAGLQFSLPAVWSGMVARGMGIERLVQAMATAPAELVGLGGRKGAIVPGADADLVAFDPEAQWTVEESQVLHRHRLTPFAGLTLRGRVERVWLRGTEGGGSGREAVRPVALN